MVLDYEKINMLSGAFTAPFIDGIIEDTGTIESVTILCDIITTFHQHELDCECIQLLQLFSEIIGVSFSDEINEIPLTLAACFIDEHLKDIKDLLYDLL